MLFQDHNSFQAELNTTLKRLEISDDATDIRRETAEYFEMYSEDLETFPEIAGKSHWNLIVDDSTSTARFTFMGFDSDLTIAIGEGPKEELINLGMNDSGNSEEALAKLTDCSSAPIILLRLHSSAVDNWLQF